MAVSGLIKQVKRCLTRASVAEQRCKKASDAAEKEYKAAEREYLKAGKALVQLKEQAEHGEWLPALKKVGCSQQRASELMALARQTQTLAQQRERKSESMRNSRAKSPPQTPRGGDLREQDTPEPAEQEPEPTQEEEWIAEFARTCGHIVALDASWQRQYGDWQSYRLPSEYRTLAAQALDAWERITATVCRSESSNSDIINLNQRRQSK